jgi:hypothetical protein
LIGLREIEKREMEKLETCLIWQGEKLRSEKNNGSQTFFFFSPLLLRNVGEGMEVELS